MAFALDRAGQRADDVTESAGLGEGNRFRGDEGHMHPSGAPGARTSAAAMAQDA